MTTLRFGATSEEWINFSLVLGLTSDLLPVVANPNAVIGEHSKLRQLGKTPSRYNSSHKVGGILDWSTKITTAHEVEQWSKNEDYGICIITRRIRALDVDITDAALASAVQQCIERHIPGAAIRYRNNSPKLLVAFELVGNYSKRAIKTAHGIIEFLATGQQFIAAGTHPSGERYKWRGDIPGEFISLNEYQFGLLWATLQNTFGIEPSTETSSTDRKTKLSEAITNDETANQLYRIGSVISTERDGRLHIRCPFESSHTDPGEGSESGTTYFPRNTGGFAQGHFKCLHAHCSARTDQEYLQAIGITAADDFTDNTGAVQRDAQEPSTGTGGAAHTDASTKTADGQKEKRSYEFLPANVFAQGEAATWIIKGILPQADLAVIFGESGSGKSFFTLDLAAHVALGIPYRGKKTVQGAVAYIAAEGSRGFKNRLKAYAAHHHIELSALPITVLAASPNFMRKDNVDAVRDAILALTPRPVLIVVDTLAQVTPGANENSGEDMGRVLGHCKMLRAATGAMIALIHHSGKDASKGARGWSGIGGAEDVEFEIVRDPHSPQRVATISKLRDGGDDVEMGFKLDVVSLGADTDGDPITSCVVVPTDAGAQPAQARTPLGDIERLVLRVLDDLQGLTGEDVKINDLIEAVVSQRVPPAGGKRDTRRQVAQTTLDRLVEKGRLCFDGGIVEPVHHD